ncbi:MAG: glycosyltransferase family 4 protein [Methanophagales archaeon]|nr:glycosyltransferase family 4 protein [Methanophagales archaeon]
MKIMMCPDSGNLYLNLLTQNLKREGVKIKDIPWFGKQSPYSLLQFLEGNLKGFNILHLHWMPFNRFFMMKFVRKLSNSLNVKIVWTIHNLIPHIPRYGSIEKDVEAMKYMATWASAGIVHCEQTKKDFYEHYGLDLPLFVIPHGNFNEYAKIKASDESRRRLGISADKTVLLMLPPNRWTKGIKTFIEVIKKLPDDYVGLLAGICENPAIRKYIENESRNNPHKFLTRLDYIPNEEVGYYFAASDIFFMPYERITTSGSIINAMAYKKPIISTPQGDIYTLVENGVNGYLCNTAEEMIEKIKSIGRETAEKMGGKSYEIAERFDWRDIAKQTLRIYQKVMEK